jgi:superfamily I DNA/RNA helicase
LSQAPADGILQQRTGVSTTPNQEDDMKKMIGAAIASWLRKPENREKAKRTAKQAYDKYQQRKNGPKPGSDRNPR